MFKKEFIYKYTPKHWQGNTTKSYHYLQIKL